MSALIGTSESEPLNAARAKFNPPAKVDAAKPRVLILLATFNGENWLKEQLDSILRQEKVDLRVAINDDCSTDKTLAVLESFMRDPRICVTVSTKQSGSAAQNFFHLIRSNNGEGFDFVALADQDDLWHPDKLYRACNQKKPFSGYSSAVIGIWDNGRTSVLRQKSAPTVSDYLFEGAGQGCTFVLSAEFYGRLRKFIVAHEEFTKTLHYHDWAIYALARAWDLEWRFDGYPSMLYRQHERNDTGARNSFRGISKRFSLIRSGWYREQLFLIAQFCSISSPKNPAVVKWHSIITMPHTLKRKLRMIYFCFRGGRRRKLDTAILIVAGLAGWI